MNEHILQGKTIGELALESLNLFPAGQVMGVTTKGIFLTAGERVLFLTDAPYKSPFNLQINDMAVLAGLIKPGQAFTYDVPHARILFTNSVVAIDLSGTDTQFIPPPVVVSASREEQKRYIDAILRLFIERDPLKGWLFTMREEPHSTQTNAIFERIQKGIRLFTAAWDEEDLQGCMDGACLLVGLGGGLTPSGDDWLSGFILYRVREGFNLGVIDEFLARLAQEVVSLAERKTTRVSVSRLLAASRGLAEQPFIELIDHLFTRESRLDPRLVDVLFEFGHSSGVDTCLGIGAAIR